MRKDTKVLQVGFRKCGITSVAAFIIPISSGTRVVYHDLDRPRWRIEWNPTGDVPLTTGHGRCRAFVNMDCVSSSGRFEGFSHKELLMDEYSDSLFILSTQSKVNRLKSRAARGDGKSSTMQATLPRYGTEVVASPMDIRSADWQTHHGETAQDIPAGRFLVSDSEQDSRKLPCNFVGLLPYMSNTYLETMSRFGGGPDRCLLPAVP